MIIPHNVSFFCSNNSRSNSLGICMKIKRLITCISIWAKASWGVIAIYPLFFWFKFQTYSTVGICYCGRGTSLLLQMEPTLWRELLSLWELKCNRNIALNWIYLRVSYCCHYGKRCCLNVRASAAQILVFQFRQLKPALLFCSLTLICISLYLCWWFYFFQKPGFGINTDNSFPFKTIPSLFP
jgi:hypothetical protein